MASGNLQINEPRQVGPMGLKFPGFLESLFLLEAGSQGSNKPSENETLVTRKQGVESPRNMGHEMA